MRIADPRIALDIAEAREPYDVGAEDRDGPLADPSRFDCLLQ
jgi:hypothetical protein